MYVLPNTPFFVSLSVREIPQVNDSINRLISSRQTPATFPTWINICSRCLGNRHSKISVTSIILVPPHLHIYSIMSIFATCIVLLLPREKRVVFLLPRKTKKMLSRLNTCIVSACRGRLRYALVCACFMVVKMPGLLAHCDGGRIGGCGDVAYLQARWRVCSCRH